VSRQRAPVDVPKQLFARRLIDRRAFEAASLYQQTIDAVDNDPAAITRL
jgi:hypothetical protein